MLFADHLEARNPGRLPPPLTLESLRVAQGSVPGNPSLSEALYLAEYIKGIRTGTLVMFRRSSETGLPEPEFAVTHGFITTIRRPVPNTGRATGRGVQARVQARVQVGVQDMPQAELGPRAMAMLRTWLAKTLHVRDAAVDLEGGETERSRGRKSSRRRGVVASHILSRSSLAVGTDDMVPISV